jgi:hypothetical protein
VTAAGEFSELLHRNASADEIADWLRQAATPRKLSPEEWTALVVPVSRAVPQFDAIEGPWFHLTILDFLRWAFTEAIDFAFSYSLKPDAFTDFLSWLEAQPDSTVVRWCWDLLAHDPSRPPGPVYWLHHSGRLSGAISYENLRLAVSLNREADAQFWWPKPRWAVVRWDRDSAGYFDLLQHDRYLVRAAAAKVLGTLLYGIMEHGDRIVPAAGDLPRKLQQYEIATPASPVRSYTARPAWMLDTLRTSGRELDVQHIISLEFYASEYFSGDESAIRAFLEMGRIELAVMTATEDERAIPLIRPLLEEMAASPDPRISVPVREFLVERS